MFRLKFRNYVIRDNDSSLANFFNISLKSLAILPETCQGRSINKSQMRHSETFFILKRF